MINRVGAIAPTLNQNHSSTAYYYLENLSKGRGFYEDIAKCYL